MTMRMKKIIWQALVLIPLIAYGQGTFTYDQQIIASDTTQGGGLNLQQFLPIGQSFTPALSSIDFIRLSIFDANPGNGLGAWINLNLRSGSITGAVISSTSPVFMPDGFGQPSLRGITNFFFPSSVALTSGTTYYFDISVGETSDNWAIDIYHYGYSGGRAYIGGVADANDVWFREGTFSPAPEPATVWLGLLGGSLLLFLRRVNRDVLPKVAAKAKASNSRCALTVSETVSESIGGVGINCGELDGIVFESPIKPAILAVMNR
jgi:hypothetical protein